MSSSFTKVTYIGLPPLHCLFRAVSQSCLGCCLPGCGPHLPQIKLNSQPSLCPSFLSEHWKTASPVCLTVPSPCPRECSQTLTLRASSAAAQLWGKRGVYVLHVNKAVFKRQIINRNIFEEFRAKKPFESQ